MQVETQDESYVVVNEDSDREFYLKKVVGGRPTSTRMRPVVVIKDDCDIVMYPSVSKAAIALRADYQQVIRAVSGTGGAGGDLPGGNYITYASRAQVMRTKCFRVADTSSMVPQGAEDTDTTPIECILVEGAEGRISARVADTRQPSRPVTLTRADGTKEVFLSVSLFLASSGKSTSHVYKMLANGGTGVGEESLSYSTREELRASPKYSVVSSFLNHALPDTAEVTAAPAPVKAVVEDAAPVITPVKKTKKEDLGLGSLKSILHAIKQLERDDVKVSIKVTSGGDRLKGYGTLSEEVTNKVIGALLDEKKDQAFIITKDVQALLKQ